MFVCIEDGLDQLIKDNQMEATKDIVEDAKLKMVIQLRCTNGSNLCVFNNLLTPC